MNELIAELVATLGVSPVQARGGSALIFAAAREKLGDAAFDRLIGGIDGVTELLQAAPRPGGAAKLFGKLAGAAGGGRAAMIANVLAGFRKLGMTSEHAKTFAPIILAHMRTRLDPAAASDIERALRA